MTSTCTHGRPWSCSCDRCGAEQRDRSARRKAELGRLCRDMRVVAENWPDPVRSALLNAARVLDIYLTPGAP